MVKLGASGSYLGADKLKNGDLVTFKSEGEWITSDKYKYDDGNFKKSFVIDVSFDGEAYKMRVNKTSRDALVGSLGEDTADWVGKEAVVTKEHSRQIDKDIVYLDGAKKTPKTTEEDTWED